MQGKYSSELALPLNELLTVVLITHIGRRSCVGR
jgi:hypothetical protein